MKKSKLFPLVLVLMAAFAIAQVYKWVDEDGSIHFGDKPPEEVIAEELDLPAGPSEEDIARAQEDLRRRLEARKISDEAGTTERRGAQTRTPEIIEPEAGIESVRNQEFACFTPLSVYVKGESAQRYVPITPTELTGEQQTLLKNLFSGIGRYWRGNITDVTCTGNTSDPDIKSLHFEVKTTVKWDARKSQLEFESDASGKEDRSVKDLIQRYRVGDGLYVKGGAVLSEGWSNIAVPGNMVEILTLERNTLIFLIKRRIRPAVSTAEIRYLELAGNRLSIRRLYFANDGALSGWRIWALIN